MEKKAIDMMNNTPEVSFASIDSVVGISFYLYTNLENSENYLSE
jgi:hypothetical protein